MIGEIFIEGLAMKCIIGFNDWERHSPQDILIDIEMTVDFTSIDKSDNPHACCDYHLIANKISSFVEGSAFNLIETLALRVADLVLENNLVHQVSVKVNKPGALKDCRNVSSKIVKKMKQDD